MANQAKKKRTQALSRFTRNVNTLETLLDENSPTELVHRNSKLSELFGSLWKMLKMTLSRSQTTWRKMLGV